MDGGPVGILRLLIWASCRYQHLSLNLRYFCAIIHELNSKLPNRMCILKRKVLSRIQLRQMEILIYCEFKDLNHQGRFDQKKPFIMQTYFKVIILKLR